MSKWFKINQIGKPKDGGKFEVGDTTIQVVEWTAELEPVDGGEAETGILRSFSRHADGIAKVGAVVLIEKTDFRGGTPRYKLATPGKKNNYVNGDDDRNTENPGGVRSGYGPPVAAGNAPAQPAYHTPPRPATAARGRPEGAAVGNAISNAVALWAAAHPAATPNFETIGGYASKILELSAALSAVGDFLAPPRTQAASAVIDLTPPEEDEPLPF